jgi:hypothetical protein
MTTIEMDAAGVAAGTELRLTITDENEEQFAQTRTVSGGKFTWGPNITVLTNIIEVQILFSSVLAGSPPFSVGAVGAEPHVVCVDRSRLDVYHNGSYRLFEDPESGVMVNIGVDNTYTTFVAVLDRDGHVFGHTDFDVDSNRQLHANFIEHVDGTIAEQDEKRQRMVIKAGDDITVRVDAKYRSVSVENSRWNSTERQTVRLGGVLAAIIQEVSGPKDVTPGQTRDVVLNEYSHHALACDAHFPHIVSFFGASVIPGAGDAHNLLHINDVEVKAKMDFFSRLLELEVSKGGSRAVLGKWSRKEAEAGPPQDRAPDVELEVAEAGNAIVERTDVPAFGGPAAEATRAHDFLVPLGDKSREGHLLVRLQANGAASFSIKGTRARIHLSRASGLLVKRDENESAAVAAAGSASSAVSESVYEKLVEPHLAWRRGEATQLVDPDAASFSVRGIGAV